MSPEIYEKLGLLYLGREVDPEGQPSETPLLYDSRHLTTHGVCVGMTGSGKTGLCLALLEEAAMDGIPALIIDPKGDLGNLLLTFPKMSGPDFLPWVNEEDAGKAGVSLDEFAAAEAEKWKEGLAQWGQTPERIATLREKCEIAIYTPGSNAGIPLSILRSFEAPSAEVAADSELLAERVQSTTSSLLGLLGIDADPLQSREFSLLSALLQQAWKNGQSPDLAGLIAAVQEPPFEKIGVLSIEDFFSRTSAPRFGHGPEQSARLARLRRLARGRTARHCHPPPYPGGKTAFGRPEHRASLRPRAHVFCHHPA
jgi:Domain of unknown function DUF87.